MTGLRTDFVDGFVFVETPGLTGAEHLASYTINLRVKQVLAFGLLAAARSSSAAPPQPTPTSAANWAPCWTANTLLTATIDTTREDILRSLQARYLDLEQGAAQHPRRVVVTRQVSRIPEERAQAFQERLVALLEEFKAADVASDDLQTYAFTVAFYPSFYFHHTDEQQGTLG